VWDAATDNARLFSGRNEFVKSGADIYVPHDLPPGTYTGQILVLHRHTNNWAVLRIELQVCGFTLPDKLGLAVDLMHYPLPAHRAWLAPAGGGQLSPPPHRTGVFPDAARATFAGHAGHHARAWVKRAL
jgi:hypothetical protein